MGSLEGRGEGRETPRETNAKSIEAVRLEATRLAERQTRWATDEDPNFDLNDNSSREGTKLKTPSTFFR